MARYQNEKCGHRYHGKKRLREDPFLLTGFRLAAIEGALDPYQILRDLPEWLLEEWQEFFSVDNTEAERAYAMARLAGYIPRFSKGGGQISTKDFMLSQLSVEKATRKKTTPAQWSSFFAGYGPTQGKEEN